MSNIRERGLAESWEKTSPGIHSTTTNPSDGDYALLLAQCPSAGILDNLSGARRGVIMTKIWDEDALQQRHHSVPLQVWFVVI